MSEETKDESKAKPVNDKAAVKSPAEGGQRLSRLLALFQDEGKAVRTKIEALEAAVTELGGKMSSETRTKVAADLSSAGAKSSSLWPDIIDEIHALLTSPDPKEEDDDEKDGE